MKSYSYVRIASIWLKHRLLKWDGAVWGVGIFWVLFIEDG